MRSRLSKFLLIAPVLLAIIVDYFGWGLVYPLATAVMDDPDHGLLPIGTSIKLRDFYLSLSFLFYPLCMLFGASSLGDLSDIYGRKKILLFSTFGIGCSFLCMGFGIFTHTLWLFLAGRALSGFMAGTVPIAQAAVIDLSSSEDKPFNLALLSITFGVGLILGPLVGAFLADAHLISWFGYTTPFFFSAVLAFITFGWIRFSFSYPERVNPIKEFSFLRPLILFKEVFQNVQLRQLVWVLFLFQLGVSLYIQTILISFNTQLHYTGLGLGLFWMVLGIGFIIGLVVLKRLIRTTLVSVSRIVFYSIGGQGIAIILSSFIGNEEAFWVLGFIFSLLNPSSYALLMAFFSDTAPQESQGWVMGIWSSTISLAFIAGGVCNNLVPLIGLHFVILLAGVIVAVSGYVFHRFVKR